MLLLGHSRIPHRDVVLITAIDSIRVSVIGALPSSLTRVLLCVKLLGL